MTKSLKELWKKSYVTVKKTRDSLINSSHKKILGQSTSERRKFITRRMLKKATKTRGILYEVKPTDAGYPEYVPTSKKKIERDFRIKELLYKNKLTHHRKEIKERDIKLREMAKGVESRIMEILHPTAAAKEEQPTTTTKFLLIHKFVKTIDSKTGKTVWRNAKKGT